MGDVLPFGRKTPHLTGDARCLDCRHEWVALVELEGRDPNGWLECPRCALVKGRMVYAVLRGAGQWHCACGNDLFQATADMVYCPNCGTEQRFTP